jgi:uncharacterized protein (TIGR04222 family)
VHEAEALYLLAAGAIVLAVVARIVVLRAQCTRPGELGRPYGHIELSLLTGNRRLAVLASLGALRAAGSIDAHSWGAFRAEAPPPDEATAVDRAVYAAIGRGASLVTLNKDETVAGALAAVEDELRTVGALPRMPSRRFYARVYQPLLAAFVIAPIIFALIYHSPVWGGIALFLTAAPFVVTTIAVVLYDRGTTRFGRRTREHASAHDLPTAVALNGVEALWAADRPFAERGRLPQPDPPGSDVDE